MNNELEKLISILTQLVGAHTQLLEIATAMNRAIKAKDLAEIQRTLQYHDQASVTIQELEEQRLACCDSLAVILDNKRPHLTLTALLDLLPADATRTRLATLRSNLRNAIMALARINCSNQILLTEELQYIGRMVGMVTRLQSKFTNYKNSGAKTGTDTRISLINRVI